MAASCSVAVSAAVSGWDRLHDTMPITSSKSKYLDFQCIDKRVVLNETVPDVAKYVRTGLLYAATDPAGDTNHPGQINGEVLAEIDLPQCVDLEQGFLGPPADPQLWFRLGGVDRPGLIRTDEFLLHPQDLGCLPLYIDPHPVAIGDNDSCHAVGVADRQLDGITRDQVIDELIQRVPVA